jgi:hypothetical protein
LTVNFSKLKAVRDSDLVAKAILDHFATRERNRKETRVDNLERALSGIARPDIIRVFKELEKLGCGTYFNGGRGGKSWQRFEWKYELISIGKAAAGEAQDIQEVQPTTDLPAEHSENKATTTRDDAIKHTYQLREDWQVELDLPKNLSDREAGRLSDFIKTLPFGGGVQA